MHAKIAIADQTTLFVTSANLTASGISNNVEAGVLIRGGEAPAGQANISTPLRRDGYLTPL
jgi:phosphatidylserine/phosphatidylglycerophosphate/cardiolipin synthase-like enzyme